jgi:hypothetical protein
VDYSARLTNAALTVAVQTTDGQIHMSDLRPRRCRHPPRWKCPHHVELPPGTSASRSRVCRSSAAWSRRRKRDLGALRFVCDREGAEGFLLDRRLHAGPTILSRASL